MQQIQHQSEFISNLEKEQDAINAFIDTLRKEEDAFDSRKDKRWDCRKILQNLR